MPLLFRRLLAGTAAFTIALLPVSAAANGMPSLDSLWNEPEGLSMDSALYPVQAWWDGFNRTVSDDPTQRGLAELRQANADLLNAYALLQHAHSGGPQPVAVIDPLFASLYNAITGANVKAPVGSVFNAINQALLQMQGRQSSPELARALLQDYRSKQAVAVRDLHVKGGAEVDTMLTGNAERAGDFLARVKLAAAPADGLSSLLEDAGHETASLAGSHGRQVAAAHNDGKAANPGKGTGKPANPGQGKANGDPKNDGKQPAAKN